MTVLVEAVRVTKIFTSGLVQRTTTVALEDFSLSLDTDRPSITGIVGESGSGKSTMARLLLGLETPTSGAVLYRGKDLRTLNREERHRFRREVQVVFQDPFGTYNSFYKVDHVLEVPIAKFRLASSPAEARALMEQTLQTVGLRPAETLGRYPHQLSGGQRQRLMVARALLLRPKVIIADEPVSMIDASLRATVLDTLRQLHDEFGISLIYITHDLTTAYQISQNLVVLYNGTVAEAGDVELVVKQPRHPYTQLLVSSIPLPDPTRQWSDEPEPSPIGAMATPGVGCKFAPRCPHAFEPCLQKAPPLYQSDGRRAATCYLQMDRPVVPWEEMDELLTPNGATVEAVPTREPTAPAIQ
ncbi:MAG: ABC transporter ATP-binding protein [Chloroflexi bacterium]|nr:MAG: ABC transporter ATP-binding protein [Chloroflexota bacterium]